MLALLSGVGDKAYLSRFLHEVMLSHYTGGENEDLPAALKLVGPKATGRFLLALVDTHFIQRSKETLDLPPSTIRTTGSVLACPPSANSSFFNDDQGAGRDTHVMLQKAVAYSDDVTRSQISDP